MLTCFSFITEPAKQLTAKIKEVRGRAEREKWEGLGEEQLLVVELIRDLRRVCQRSEVLDVISSLEDSWSVLLCQTSILAWASLLHTQKRAMQTGRGSETAGQEEEKEEQEEEQETEEEEEDLDKAKATLLTWMKDLRAQPEQSVCPGERVARALQDLLSAWRGRRTHNLQMAVELVMMTLLSQGLDKDGILQEWLVWKQRTQNIGATPYIPQEVWNWISEAAVEVTLDLDTANSALLISADSRRMRSGFQRRDVPNLPRRFDGWWCAVGAPGFGEGRHYWEAEVGERDWRLGVAGEGAARKGFLSLNEGAGYLTLRLERGAELKALTVPVTPLPLPGILPRRVGVHLDFGAGQLSFYDAVKRSHLYTYNRRLHGTLAPVFGTVEVGGDLVLRPPPGEATPPCRCPAPCLWT